MHARKQVGLSDPERAAIAKHEAPRTDGPCGKALAGERVSKIVALPSDTVATAVRTLQEFVLKWNANDPKRYAGPTGRAKTGAAVRQ